MITVRHIYKAGAASTAMAPVVRTVSRPRRASVRNPGQVMPEEPTARELMENFAGAMGRWARAGFKTVSADVYGTRAGICERCDLWDGKARLGLGKCNAPDCGCTRIKRWLVSERCPLGKW